MPDEVLANKIFKNSSVICSLLVIGIPVYNNYITLYTKINPFGLYGAIALIAFIFLLFLGSKYV